MKARSVHQHSVFQSDTVRVKFKCVPRSFPNFVGDCPSCEKFSRQLHVRLELPDSLSTVSNHGSQNVLRTDVQTKKNIFGRAHKRSQTCGLPVAGVWYFLANGFSGCGFGTLGFSDIFAVRSFPLFCGRSACKGGWSVTL